MKSTYKILIAFIAVLGCIIFAFDYYKARIKFDGVIERPQIGESEKEIELVADSKDYQASLKAYISSKEIDEEKKTQMIESAKAEIDETVFNAGESSDHVSHDLNIQTDYLDGNVDATWSFDPIGAVNSDGSLNRGDLTDEGSLINVRVTLSVGDDDYIYEFPIVLFPYDKNTLEGYTYELKEALRERDEETVDKTSFTLPSVIDGKEINWKTRVNPRGLELAGLAVVCFFAIYFANIEDEKRKEKQRLKQLNEDYPRIVSNLSILMSAGLSFNSALDRICRRYITARQENKSDAREGFENLLFTYRAMKKGVGEIQAIEDFGKRANQKDYKKLALLLCQNIKKGNRELIEQLENEDARAFEIRKQLALKKGEEASTKLLIPMMGLLMIVMVILIMPATLSMNI